MITQLQKSNKLRKPVHGVGINDADYVVRPSINGKQVVCPHYRTWSNMLERCYSAEYHAKRPTYIGCSVAPEWRRFTAFKAWMKTQNWENKQLDKDLLVAGNKAYSPKACIFVSRQINSLLNTHASARGDLPIGVSRDGNRFVAQVSIDGNRQRIGSFTTSAEAHTAYSTAKAAHIRRISAEQTDPRIVTALNRHAKLFENGEIR